MILPSIDFKISTYNYCKTEWRYFGVSGQIADLDPVNKSRDALIPVTDRSWAGRSLSLLFCCGITNYRQQGPV